MDSGFGNRVLSHSLSDSNEAVLNQPTALRQLGGCYPLTYAISTRDHACNLEIFGHPLVLSSWSHKDVRRDNRRCFLVQSYALRQQTGDSSVNATPWVSRVNSITQHSANFRSRIEARPVCNPNQRSRPPVSCLESSLAGGERSHQRLFCQFFLRRCLGGTHSPLSYARSTISR